MSPQAVQKSYHRKCFLSYAGDVICLGFFGLVAGALEYIPPRVIDVPTDDPSIKLPVVDSVWVPSLILPLFNMGLPLLTIIAFMAAERFKNRRLLVAIIGLFLAVSLAFLTTNILKNSIGRLRPDFLTRPISSDQRRSFPSGHASSSFAGMGFTAFFIAGQIGTFDGTAHLYRFILFLIPFIVAGLVSISRILDHRHHWDDVLVGSLIGITAATLAYFFYFPALTSENCHQPRSKRFDQIRAAVEEEQLDSSNGNGQTSNAQLDPETFVKETV